MKANLLKYTMAGTMLLILANPSLAEEKEKYVDEHAVKHLVNAGDVIGSDLWDFQGNKIGSIDRVMLEPSGKTVLVVINADDLLEEDRKVAIPWSKVYVRTKSGDSDEIIYTLDVTKERLREAPQWNSDTDANDPAKADASFRFWGVERERTIQAGQPRVRLDQNPARDEDAANDRTSDQER